MDEFGDRIYSDSLDPGIYEHDEREEELGMQSDTGSEREEMECALYTQIYFQEENDNKSENNSFNINVFPDNELVDERGHRCDFEDSQLHVHIHGSPPSETEPKIDKSGNADKFNVSKTKSRKTSSLAETDSDNCSSQSSDIEMAFDDGMLSENENFSKNLKFNVKADQVFLLSNRRSSDAKACNNNWEIDDEDRPSLRQPSWKKGAHGKMFQRYHEPVAMTMRCYNCNEIGHMSHVCPKPQKNIICIHCGVTGHNWRDCLDVICYNCDRLGHIAKECVLPRTNVNLKCHRCFMYGHYQQTCSDAWRQFHMTTSLSLVRCKVKRNPNMWCYNCARRGHFGYECNRERFMRHTMPLYPFIRKYRDSDCNLRHVIVDENGNPAEYAEDWKSQINGNKKQHVSREKSHNCRNENDYDESCKKKKKKKSEILDKSIKKKKEKKKNNKEKQQSGKMVEKKSKNSEKKKTGKKKKQGESKKFKINEIGNNFSKSVKTLNGEDCDNNPTSRIPEYVDCAKNDLVLHHGGDRVVKESGNKADIKAIDSLTIDLTVDSTDNAEDSHDHSNTDGTDRKRKNSNSVTNLGTVSDPICLSSQSNEELFDYNIWKNIDSTTKCVDYRDKSGKKRKKKNWQTKSMNHVKDAKKKQKKTKPNKMENTPGRKVVTSHRGFRIILD
ncbi:hypothetical protein ScPMuIL_004432 [Solemya velum]